MECGRPDLNRGILPRIRRVRLADHRSAAIPGYATAAWLTLLASWRTALRRGRVVVRPSLLGRPSRSPRPDSHRGLLVQGQVGLLLPHGAMVAPPRFERGPPRPGRGALPVAPRGCCRRIRENTGQGAPRDGVAHRPDTKTQRHPGTRVSVWRRHYLRVMPLAAVGTRYIPMGSTMPCASCNRSPRT